MSIFQRTATKRLFGSLLFGLLILGISACGTTATTTSTSSDDGPVTMSTPSSVSVDHLDLTGANNSVSYSFTTLNDQKDPTFNQLLGINNSGVIAGYFGVGSAQHPNKGYTLKSPYHQNDYTNENFPHSVQTQVTAINNHGQTAGFWVDGNGNNFGFILWNGHFNSYRDPKTGTGTVNQLLGLNINGIAVGFYTDANGITSHAYSLNRHTGKFTAINPPNAVSAMATGINDHGDITGALQEANGNVLGFLLRGKSYTEFTFPGTVSTDPLGINNSDQIVGSYVSNGLIHGFLVSQVWKHASFLSIDDPKGLGTTIINGLNDKGQLVGFYVDSNNNTDGFLANPHKK